MPEAGSGHLTGVGRLASLSISLQAKVTESTDYVPLRSLGNTVDSLPLACEDALIEGLSLLPTEDFLTYETEFVLLFAVLGILSCVWAKTAHTRR